MYQLIIKNARIIDPLNGVDMRGDIAASDGKIQKVAPSISEPAERVEDLAGKIAIPGIIDMHTHMRTVLGHPHAQRMVALAGVCTTMDLAGPLDNILDSIPGSGSGINMAILEAARAPQTLSSGRPSGAEIDALIDKTLKMGGFGVKLLGGHFPMDLDISQRIIERSAAKESWVAWHVGNSVHGSNIEGLRDAVQAAGSNFLHVAHVNSYCRGQVSTGLEESIEAISLLKAHPNLFSESYLSPLNGTRLTIKDNAPASKVTVTCVKRFGYEPTYEGMKQCIRDGKAGVLRDDGNIGRLIFGEEGVEYWESKNTETVGSFSVNPAESRFLLAAAKRADGSFVVDSFSTDGGTYPRNVIAENGLLLVKFGALTLNEFAVKASLNGARALGLPQKGQLGEGADADITVLDYEAGKAFMTIVGGKVIMKDGVLCGKGTTIICQERGVEYLKSRGIPFTVAPAPSVARIEDRFVPKH